jgi:nitroreductase
VTPPTELPEATHAQLLQVADALHSDAAAAGIDPAAVDAAIAAAVATFAHARVHAYVGVLVERDVRERLHLRRCSRQLMASARGHVAPGSRALRPYPADPARGSVDPDPARVAPPPEEGTRPMSEIPAALGLSGTQIAGLLDTAGRAPSLHNAQPWLFRILPDVIELHADLRRRLPVADPEDRELRIGCGAALFTLCLALHAHAVRPAVTVLPDPHRPALLAEIRHGGTTPPTPEQRRLLDAVPRRHTNRHPFSDVAVADHEQHTLRRAALDEGAWLHVVEDPHQRHAIEQLALRAHRAQDADPAFADELRRWTGAGADRADGVPAIAGGPRTAPQDRWVLRDYTADTAPERVPGKDFEHRPLIAVLTSHLSGHAAEIQTGQALQHVLLAATADGLAVSFLSQIVELPGPREELRRVIGGTRPPQAVLRIGRGWPVTATPRRPVADLIAPAPTPTA